jgi:hypothetical protein
VTIDPEPEVAVSLRRRVAPARALALEDGALAFELGDRQVEEGRTGGREEGHMVSVRTGRKEDRADALDEGVVVVPRLAQRPHGQVLDDVRDAGLDRALIGAPDTEGQRRGHRPRGGGPEHRDAIDVRPFDAR